MQIRKPPLQRILTHTPTADLVGHEDKRGVLSRETVELCLGLLENILHCSMLSLEEIVGQPERDAVDDHHTSADIMTAQRLLLFDVRPLFATTLLMEAHPFTKLLIPDSGCGQIDGIRCETQGKALCLTTLARALSTCDQYDSACHCFLLISSPPSSS